MDRFIETLKKRRLTLIAAAVLLVFGGSFTQKDESAKESVDDYPNYAQTLENELLSLLSGIDGVHGARVMVVLADGGSSVYAENSSGSGSSYVVLDDSPLKLKSEPPSVAGVAVICGADAGLRLEITKLISSLLNIPASRVYVY